MNREIRFRAWDAHNKQMFTPEVVTGSGDVFKTGRDYEDYHPSGYPLMQFTGLRDRNGIKIYEGDLIEHQDGHRCKIEFMDGCFIQIYLNGSFEGTIKRITYSAAHCTIIGDIYNNPDLIK